MANVIARIGVYGDLHLNSKNYGAHREYAKESLDYLSKITEVTHKRGLTHLIGCGDFSYGRFHTLEYRLAVESNLKEQFEATQGNRYELMGNHDVAGYGMTERQYYIEKGLLKPSENITIGCLNLNMVDYGQHNKVNINICDDEKHYNFVIAHDFFRFVNTEVGNFGKAIELDSFEKWFGVDMLICGHVHKILDFSGFIQKGEMSHQCEVHYLGCMMRPAYREGYMDDIGEMMIITVYDDNTVDYDIETIKLWSLSDSFNLIAKEDDKEKKVERGNRVDISDVVRQLDSHDRNVGNPEDIISGMVDIPDKYKSKAIELLKSANG